MQRKKRKEEKRDQEEQEQEKKKKQHLPLRGDVFKRLSQKTGEVRWCDH